LFDGACQYCIDSTAIAPKFSDLPALAAALADAAADASDHSDHSDHSADAAAHAAHDAHDAADSADLTADSADLTADSAAAAAAHADSAAALSAADAAADAALAADADLAAAVSVLFLPVSHASAHSFHFGSEYTCFAHKIPKATFCVMVIIGRGSSSTTAISVNPNFNPLSLRRSPPHSASQRRGAVNLPCIGFSSTESRLASATVSAP
jgi:hypothetical protein